MTSVTTRDRQDSHSFSHVTLLLRCVSSIKVYRCTMLNTLAQEATAR
jgi:hypothetical protein